MAQKALPVLLTAYRAATGAARFGMGAGSLTLSATNLRLDRSRTRQHTSLCVNYGFGCDDPPMNMKPQLYEIV